MINASHQLVESMIADARKTSVQIVFHMVDPDIVIEPVTYGDCALYAAPDEVSDESSNIYKIATIDEKNRWILDGSFDLLSDLPMNGTAYASADISTEETRNISDYVQLNFTGVTLLQAYTIFFSDELCDGIPEEFTVDIYQTGGVVAYTETFSDNSLSKIQVEGFSVSNPVAIRITASKMNLSNRRFRVAEIVAGIHETWQGDEFVSCNIKHQVDLRLASLPYGTCSLVIDNSTKRFDPRNKSSLFKSLEDRLGIDVFFGVGNPVEYIKLGHYYMANNGWKTSDSDNLTLKWELFDIIGLVHLKNFVVPETYPTTLSGWMSEIMSQIDSTIATMYEIESGYESTSCVIGSSATIDKISCGDMIRFLCEWTGLFPTATADGKLRLSKIVGSGIDYRLDNLNSNPKMQENIDIDRFDVTIYPSIEPSSGSYIGNSTLSGNTRTINNPFIRTSDDAQDVVNRLLMFYGGNVITLVGRGNFISELGDIDNIEMDESNAMSGVRYLQTFNFHNGILSECQSELIQGEGAQSYDHYEILTENQVYSFPSGITSARILLVGGGYDGEDGQDGSFSRAGKPGKNGSGGKVYTDIISFNDGTTFNVVIGSANGGESSFGAYTSADGTLNDNGYGDFITGKSYGRTGVKTPRANSGDGGKGGDGGSKGERHLAPDHKGYIVDVDPTNGKKGSKGANGAVIVYWNEVE